MNIQLGIHHKQFGLLWIIEQKCILGDLITKAISDTTGRVYLFKGKEEMFQ